MRRLFIPLVVVLIWSLPVQAQSAPAPHEAKGVVQASRNDVTVGEIKVVEKVTQPDSKVRKANEATAARFLAYLKDWMGRRVHVKGLSGFRAGQVRSMGRGRTMLTRGQHLRNQIQVLETVVPARLSQPAQQTFTSMASTIDQGGKSYTVFGPAAGAVPLLTGQQITVRGYRFDKTGDGSDGSGTSRDEVYVVAIKRPGENEDWIVGMHESGNVLLKGPRDEHPRRHDLATEIVTQRMKETADQYDAATQALDNIFGDQ